jgi:cardiolipin synthase
MATMSANGNAMSRPVTPHKRDRQVADSPYRDRLVTIPNLICLVRLVGSICLVGIAWAGYSTVFVVGFIVLSLSDWVDGKLARWLNQRSKFGARLDSASDAVLYTCLIIGSLILKWDVLAGELSWILVALASYAMTTGLGLWKYGKVPSYHTYAAKFSQWLVLGGAVAMLLDWSLWPLRISTVAVTLTNIEAMAITCLLKHWHADILSITHILKRRTKVVGRS